MTRTADRRTGARRPLFGTVAGTVLATALVLAACEGDNLFSGGPPGGEGSPRVGSVSAPDFIAEGSRLDVRIRAIAPAGMERVDVRFRRAINEDQAFQIDGNRTDSVTIDASVNIPATVQDSIIVIEAFATDRLGRKSDVVTTTVHIDARSLPTVNVTVTPSGTASISDVLRIRVSAQDVFGLQFLGYAILTAAGDTVHGGSTLVPVSGVLRDTVFVVALPAGLAASTVNVLGIAVNNQQRRGVSAPLALSLTDGAAPRVEILSPRLDESFPLTDSILVRVHVRDSSGIANVSLKGVAIRQDSLQNTQVVTRYLERTVPFPQAPSTLLPVDTVIQRWLRPASDTTSEPVHIIVAAVDGSGNVGADTVRIQDGPRVTILNPADGTTVGLSSIMLVRLSAVDRVAGLDSVKLIVDGVVQQVVRIRDLTVQVLDTTIAVLTGPVAGQITLQAGVWNRRGTGGFTPQVAVNVSTQSVVDVDRPQVMRRVESGTRVELSDTIRIVVRATDGQGSGVRRMGAVVIATPDTDLLPQRVFHLTTGDFNPPLSGTPERVFDLTLGDRYNVTEAKFPRTFTLQVHAFAIDVAGNCGAAVGTVLASVACDTLSFNGVNFHTARGQTPAAIQLTAVDGQSVGLPGGGRIADAVVDPTRRRIYLSNITNNRVDIFNLGPDTFDITGARVGACRSAPAGIASCRGVVGAAPWGLFINNGGDSLIVANSGGTNISFLQLDGTDYMREHVGRRLLTPNVVLWELTSSISNGRLRFTRKFYDFSDRPQFVAQHSSGTLLYSTLPTLTNGAGTIRIADTNPDPGSSNDLPEGYILFPGNAVREVDDSWAIANIDSVLIVRSDTEDDLVILFDHKPGYYDQPGSPGDNIFAGPLPLFAAAADLASQGSDIVVYAGGWNLEQIAMTDTTFVAASTDRTRIAFGEGATAAAGRIFMCCTITPGPPLRVGISDVIAVTDLLNNASERVSGLGLNANGSLGVARGRDAAYFFTPDLRLQGEFRSGVAGGAGGAALHPNHTAALETGDRALSFVATPNRTIKIIDTAHFYERGEIHIRDNVVGPLRTAMPTAAENAGRAPSDPNYIVVKLIGVTAGDNVVIIDVRRKDVGG